MDNVRNLVGSPIAGIDPLEIVDTRPYCKMINDFLTVSKQDFVVHLMYMDKKHKEGKLRGMY
jgi:sulfite reductase beta subunit-like hemoprotein